MLFQESWGSPTEAFHFLTKLFMPIQQHVNEKFGISVFSVIFHRNSLKFRINISMEKNVHPVIEIEQSVSLEALVIPEFLDHSIDPIMRQVVVQLQHQRDRNRHENDRGDFGSDDFEICFSDQNGHKGQIDQIQNLETPQSGVVSIVERLSEEDDEVDHDEQTEIDQEQHSNCVVVVFEVDHAQTPKHQNYAQHDIDHVITIAVL
jgi:hypothetical protein